MSTNYSITRSHVNNMKQTMSEHTRKMCHFITAEFQTTKEYIIKAYQDTKTLRLIAAIDEERKCYIVIKKLEEALVYILRDVAEIAEREQDHGESEENEEGQELEADYAYKQLTIIERFVDQLFEEKAEQIQILSEDTNFESLLNYMFRKMKKLLLTYQANFIRPVRYALATIKQKQDEALFKKFTTLVDLPDLPATSDVKMEEPSPGATEDLEKEKCAICQYELPKSKQQLFTMKCTHSFHIHCGLMIKVNKAPCPICRFTDC